MQQFLRRLPLIEWRHRRVQRAKALVFLGIKVNYIRFLERRSGFLATVAFRNRRLKQALFTWLKRKWQVAKLEAVCADCAWRFRRARVLQRTWGRLVRNTRQSRAIGQLLSHWGQRRRQKLVAAAWEGLQLRVVRSRVDRHRQNQVAQEHKRSVWGWFRKVVAHRHAERKVWQEKISSFSSILKVHPVEFTFSIWKSAYQKQVAVQKRASQAIENLKRRLYFGHWAGQVALQSKMSRALRTRPFLAAIFWQFLKTAGSPGKPTLLTETIGRTFFHQLRKKVAKRNFFFKIFDTRKLKRAFGSLAYFQALSRRNRQGLAIIIHESRRSILHRHLALWKSSFIQKNFLNQLRQSHEQETRREALRLWQLRLQRRILGKSILLKTQKLLSSYFKRWFWTHLVEFSDKMGRIASLGIRADSDFRLKRVHWDAMRTLFLRNSQKRITDMKKAATAQALRRQHLKRACFLGLRKLSRQAKAVKIIMIRRKMALWANVAEALRWLSHRVTWTKEKIGELAVSRRRRTLGMILRSFQIHLLRRKRADQAFRLTKNLKQENLCRYHFGIWKKKWTQLETRRQAVQLLAHAVTSHFLSRLFYHFKVHAELDQELQRRSKAGLLRRFSLAWRDWVTTKKLRQHQLDLIRARAAQGEGKECLKIWKDALERAQAAAQKASEFRQNHFRSTQKSILRSLLKITLKSKELALRKEAFRAKWIGKWISRWLKLTRKSRSRGEACAVVEAAHRLTTLRTFFDDWANRHLKAVGLDQLRTQTRKLALADFFSALLSYRNLLHLLATGLDGPISTSEFTPDDFLLIQKGQRLQVRYQTAIRKASLGSWKALVDSKRVAIDTFCRCQAKFGRLSQLICINLLRAFLKKKKFKIAAGNQLAVAVVSGVRCASERVVAASMNTLLRIWRIEKGCHWVDQAWMRVKISSEYRQGIFAISFWAEKRHRTTCFLERVSAFVRAQLLEQGFRRLQTDYRLRLGFEKLGWAVHSKRNQLAGIFWGLLKKEVFRLELCHQTIRKRTDSFQLRTGFREIWEQSKLAKETQQKLQSVVEGGLLRSHVRFWLARAQETASTNATLIRLFRTRIFWRFWRQFKQNWQQKTQERLQKVHDLVTFEQKKFSFVVLRAVFNRQNFVRAWVLDLEAFWRLRRTKVLSESLFELKLEYWTADNLPSAVALAMESRVADLQAKIRSRKDPRVLRASFLELRTTGLQVMNLRIQQEAVVRSVDIEKRMRWALSKWLGAAKELRRLLGLAATIEKSTFRHNGKILLAEARRMIARRQFCQVIVAVAQSNLLRTNFTLIQNYLRVEHVYLQRKSNRNRLKNIFNDLQVACRASADQERGALVQFSAQRKLRSGIRVLHELLRIGREGALRKETAFTAFRNFFFRLHLRRLVAVCQSDLTRATKGQVLWRLCGQRQGAEPKNGRLVLDIRGRPENQGPGNHSSPICKTSRL